MPVGRSGSYAAGGSASRPLDDLRLVTRCSTEQSVHFLGHVPPHCGQRMGVNPKRKRDVGMSEALRHNRRRDVLEEHKRRSRMSQVVEPDRRQSGPLQQLHEVAVRVPIH